MKSDATILGINEHLFLSMTCIAMFMIDLLCAFYDLSKSTPRGIGDIVFAGLFLAVGLIQLGDYIAIKTQSNRIDRFKKAITEAFYGYVIKYSADPEAYDIISVDIYDVDDDLVKDFRRHCWDIIEQYENKLTKVSFVPSIHKHSDTVKYYPDYVKK